MATERMLLILMLGFNVAIDQVAMVSSMHWHGYVLRREDGHEGLRLKIKGRKRLERTWKKQVEEKA